MENKIEYLKDVKIGKILDYTIEFYKRHFKIISIITLIMLVPYLAIVEIFSGSQINLKDLLSNPELVIQNLVRPQQDFLEIIIDMLLGVMTIIYSFTVEIIYFAAIVMVISYSMKGIPIPKAKEIIKKALKCYPSLLIYNLLLGVLYFVAVIISYIIVIVFAVVGVGIFGLQDLDVFQGLSNSEFLIILGIIIGVLLLIAILLALTYIVIIFSLGSYSIVMENVSGVKAFARSIRMARGNISKIGLGYSFIGIIYFIFTKSTIILLELINLLDIELFNIVYSNMLRPVISIVGSIFMPIFIIFLAIYYISIKVKKEGYDLEVKIIKMMRSQNADS